MIDAVLIHLDGAVINVILAAGELNLLPVVELNLAALQRAVGGDFEFSFGAGDSAQIAAALFDLGRHAGPRRVMIGDANLLHRGQIGDVNVEVLRRHRAGGDVVLDVLRQTGEQKLIAARETAGRLRLHRNLFPLGGTLKAGIQLDAGRAAGRWEARKPI